MINLDGAESHNYNGDINVYDPIALGFGSFYNLTGGSGNGNTNQSAGGDAKGGSFTLGVNLDPSGDLKIPGLGLQNLDMVDKIAAFKTGIDQIAYMSDAYKSAGMSELPSGSYDLSKGTFVPATVINVGLPRVNRQHHRPQLVGMVQYI